MLMSAQGVDVIALLRAATTQLDTFSTMGVTVTFVVGPCSRSACRSRIASLGLVFLTLESALARAAGGEAGAHRRGARPAVAGGDDRDLRRAARQAVRSRYRGAADRRTARRTRCGRSRDGAWLPDVTVRDAGRGGFNIDIRGARKGAVSVLVDGVLVTDPYYGTFDVSTIPITDIVQIRVSTTPQSPIDGPGGPGG